MPTANKNFAWWILAAVLLTPLAVYSATAPAQERRNVLTHGDGDTIWLATIGQRAPDASSTAVFVRRKFGEDTWNGLPPIPSRITALSSHTGESVLLLDPSRWAWYSEPMSMRFGPPLPRSASVLAIAGDRHTLWALGQPESLPPTTRATTRPATAPATTRSARPLPPILCQFQTSGWTERPALWPTDLAGFADNGLALAIVGDKPTVAVAMPDGRIHLMHWDKQQWVRLEKPLQLPVPPRYLKVLNVANRPALWIQPDDEWEPTGSVWTRADGFAKLALTGPMPRASEMDLTYVGEQYRLLFRQDNRLFEQRYDAKGAASGQPIELKLVREKPPAEMDNWMTIAIMAVVVILVLNVLLRRRAAEQDDERDRDSD